MSDYYVDYLGKAEGWGIKKAVRGGTEFISGHQNKRAAVTAAKNHARPEGGAVHVENKSTGGYRIEADYSSTASTSTATSRSSRGRSTSSRTSSRKKSGNGPSLPGLGGMGGDGDRDDLDLPGIGGGDSGNAPSLPGFGAVDSDGDGETDDDDQPSLPGF